MSIFDIRRAQRRESLNQIAFVARAAAAEVRAGNAAALGIILRCVNERRQLLSAQAVEDASQEILETPTVSEAEN
jgi:N-acetylglucosamine kinase-like BadF-type ATPase